MYEQYEIISFTDPISGIEYNSNQIIDLKLFDYTTGKFSSANADLRINVDEAIRLNYVQLKLIQHYCEEIFETNDFLNLEFENEFKVINKKEEEEITGQNDEEKIKQEKSKISNLNSIASESNDDLLWNRIILEIDELNNNVLKIEKELIQQRQIHQNIEELIFRYNETENFKRKLDKIIEAFKRNLNLTQEFYKTNPQNVNFDELRIKHKNIDFNIEKINKEISLRIKNYNDLNEVLKKLKLKYAEFLDQINLFYEQLNELKKKINEYPDHLSNFAQNEIDLTAIDKNLKSKTSDLQSIANLSQKFKDLLKINYHILSEFKKNQEMVSPDYSGKEDSIIIENFLSEAKLKYQSILKTLDLINSLNSKFSESSSCIFSIETWFRSIETRINEEFQKISFTNTIENCDEYSNRLKNLNYEINHKQKKLKDLEKLEEKLSILYEQLFGSPFTKKKSSEYQSRVNLIESKLSDIIVSISSLDEYQQFLNDMEEKFRNIQITDDLNEENIIKNLEDLMKLKTCLEEKTKDSNCSKLSNTNSMSNIKNKILALEEKILKKYHILSGLKDFLKSHDLNMKQIQSIIDKTDSEINFEVNLSKIESIDFHLERLYKNKNKLESSKSDIFDSIIYPLTKRIEVEYVPDVLKSNKFKIFLKSISIKNEEVDYKIRVVNENILFFTEIKNNMIKYFDLTNKIDKWISLAEQKLSEPLGTSFEKLENQYEINEEISYEYTAKLADIEKLNQLSNINLEMFEKKTENSDYIMNEQSNKIEKKLNFHGKLNQINQKFDSINKLIQDRKHVLLNFLDKIKTLNEEIDVLVNRSEELNLNASKFNDSIDGYKLDSSELAEKIQSLEIEFDKLKSDLNLFKLRKEINNEEIIHLKFKKIDFNIDSIAFTLTTLRNLVIEKNSNSSTFENLVKIINDAIENGQSKANQLKNEIIQILFNEENPEFKLKQCKEKIENINQQERNINDLNKFGGKFFNTETIIEKLKKINSNYDIFVQNLEAMNIFAKKLIGFVIEINKIEENSFRELAIASDSIDDIKKSLALNENSEIISKVFDRIKSIENINFTSVNQYFKELNNKRQNLDNCVNNFLLEKEQKNFDSSNIVMNQKILKLKQQITNIEYKLELLKDCVSQYSNQMENFNRIKNKLINFIHVGQKEVLDHQYTDDLNKIIERKKFYEKKADEVNECNLDLENLIAINRSIESLQTEKANSQNQKYIDDIKQSLTDFLEKVDNLKKQNDLYEKYATKTKKFIKIYENLEKEIYLSLEDCNDLDIIENYINRLKKLTKVDLSPILEEFDGTKNEIIKTQLNDIVSKVDELNSKLNTKSAYVICQNEQIVRDQVQKIKCALESVEKDLDHYTDSFDRISDLHKKIDSITLNDAKLDERCKLDGLLQHEINKIKQYRSNLLEKIEKKLSPFNRLKNLELNFHDLDQKIKKELNFDIENQNQEELKKYINGLDKAKSKLIIFQNDLDSISNPAKTEMYDGLNLKNDEINKRLEEIVEKCEQLKASIVKKESTLKEKLARLIKLEDLIESLNNQIKVSNSRFDQKIETIKSKSEISKLDNLKAILDDEKKKKDDFKSQIDQITKDIRLLDLNINIDCLLNNFNQFERSLKNNEQNLEMSILKNSECKQKAFDLEKSLLLIENELNNLSKTKYSLSNLQLIDESIIELDVLMKNLAKTSDEIDDFKELCEGTLQNISSESSSYLMEKTVDSLIHKCNQMTRKIDETKNNLNFLNIHLKNIVHNFTLQSCYLDDLESNSSCNLVLNCVDPIVIKYQFEKMRTVNEDLHQKFILISEIKQDVEHLTSLNRDFEAKLNHLEIEEMIDGDNKYIEFLPKSASVSSLNNLENLLDKDEIFNSIHLLESKSVNFKDLLETNLNLFHRLYPICERLSLNLSNINQSISMLESDLDWLDRSNQNEISLKDKEEFFDKIYESILKNNKLFENDVQDIICSRIIDEINTNNIKCDELINDLNKQIQETSEKLDFLNEKYKKSYLSFQTKQKNSEEIYSEMNDILEWLDMVESKFSDLILNISHDNSTIENELNNQIIFNADANSQKIKVRQIELKSKQMIRQNEIEDSIEFKEKLVNIHFQLDNYIEIGVNRVNRLEEALVLSKELKLTYEPFIKSMSIIQDRLELLDDFNLTNSGLESKEFLSNKLNLLEEIDRELLEKKSDLEILVKNSKNMISICESPKSHLSKLSYLSSDSNFEGDVQSLEKNTNFELKKMIDFANQTYTQLNSEINIKKNELESILWKSADLWDKMDNLKSYLNIKNDALKLKLIISSQPDKIKLQILDNNELLNELEKRKDAIHDVKEHLMEKFTDEQLEQNQNINDLENIWLDLNNIGKNREKILNDTLHFSELFWSTINYINDLIYDLEDRLQLLENETVAIDSDSVSEQQQYHKQIIKDIDDNEAKFIDLESYGQQLIEYCAVCDHLDIDKALEDCKTSWDRIKKTVKNHEINIQMTFSKACEFQQELIYILEEISLQQEKFVNLDSSFNSDDPKTIRFQINLLKEFKEIVDPKQMEILILNRKFDELKSNIRTNQSFEVLESLQEPLNSANKEWKRLQSSISERKSNLQNILIDMGQLSEALDEIGKSIDTNLNSLDLIENYIELNSDLPIRSIDLKMARLKMVEKEIKSQGYLLARSKDKCKNLLSNQSFENEQSSTVLKTKIRTISDSNELLIKKFNELQQNYDLEQVQSSNLVCQLIDSLEWLKDMDAALDKNFFYCGLPETAREQLNKFNVFFEQIKSKDDPVNNLLQQASECHENNLKGDRMLKEAIESLSKKWSVILKKSNDKKEKLEDALSKACQFNEKYHVFVRWLNETEKCFNNLKPFSRIQEVLDEQILAHQKLQISINDHRDQILVLDSLGTYLKYYSQKQDAILIKNLLISIQNRWEKIIGKSSNRTRDLERGYQEVKSFYDQWNDLNEWLDSKLDILSQDQSINVGNNSIKIKHQITKHADFHRMLNSNQSTYDKTVKIGRKLFEKCDQDSKDRVCLQEMLLQLKNKWRILCIQSVERQKKLEEALLCSGQFHDALNTLTEWLGKVKPTLNKNESLYGDLDNVMALIEDNQQFQKQLQLKGEQVFLINKAASEIMQTNDNDEDFNFLNSKLNEMNELWNDIEDLSKNRTKRLEESLKFASEFNQSAKSCLEWLKNTEILIKQDWKKIDENEILNLIKRHEDFIRYLNENKPMIEHCLNMGNNLLQSCIPEAVINIKHLITLIQDKWDEIFKLSDEKRNYLNEAYENFKEYDNLLNELLVWLQGAEATLKALDQKPLSNKSETIDQLIKDHSDFKNELQQRQIKIDTILKYTSRDFESYFLNTMIDTKKKFNYVNKNRLEWKISEPKLKNSRKKQMFDSWRKVWLLALERQKKLKEHSDRLKEIERLKEFNFNEWRQRFMNWHKDNRARITDFFRRQDKDHDGKISRDEFVKGILNTNFPSSRLELECVADIFDHDKDGFIDYKEFLATLKPSSSNQPNFERIRDEVHRQVSLCKCSKQYHVLQVSERHFRFGDSQKLRLVRILQSTVMVRVGGGWMALDEFLIKNDPCRARGRLNIDLRDQFIQRESNVNSDCSKSPGKVKSRSLVNSNSKKTNLTDQADFCSHSPYLSGNSKTGSLGASMSDLSIDVLSENVDNTKNNFGSFLSPQKQSKVPILKKN